MRSKKVLIPLPPFDNWCLFTAGLNPNERTFETIGRICDGVAAAEGNSGKIQALKVHVERRRMAEIDAKRSVVIFNFFEKKIQKRHIRDGMK